MFQLSQYPVEQISQNFQKKFNGFKETSNPQLRAYMIQKRK